MNHYAQILGGTLKSIMTYGEMPNYPVPEEHANRIMNAQVELPGGLFIYAGDCPPGDYSGIKGIMLTLNYPTAEEGETIFNRLADGGKVTMPYAETFWADKFGMVTDKYGVHWAVNGNVH